MTATDTVPISDVTRAFLAREHGLLIDGDVAPARDGRTFDTPDPSTGERLAVDSVADRLEMARSFGAVPIHLSDEDVRSRIRELTEGRGADVTIDAVGHPDAFELACRLTRKAGTVSAIGVYAERMQVHMGLVWIKALTIRTGHANVIRHVDSVLDLMDSGSLDPTPLVTHRMRLDEAPEAYALYDRREALKIVLTP